jgi:cytochrome c-type biogenesis protein CcmF
VGTFMVSQGGALIGEIEPAKRFYPARQMPTTEVARLTRGFGQIYLALGETRSQAEIPIRAYWKPFVLFIWIGTVIMALGGTLSLMDRRLRIGAPVPAKVRPQGQPA